MPFVGHVAHEEGMVETDAALGEYRGIIKESRLNPLNGQGRHLPLWHVQPKTVQLAGIRSRRIPHTPCFKEAG